MIINLIRILKLNKFWKMLKKNFKIKTCTLQKLIKIIYFRISINQKYFSMKVLEVMIFMSIMVKLI